jgi:hypothetical protein
MTYEPGEVGLALKMPETMPTASLEPASLSPRRPPATTVHIWSVDQTAVSRNVGSRESRQVTYEAHD